MKSKDISKRFDQIRDIYQDRRQQYGDSYLMFGGVMSALFPEGVTISSDQDFAKLGILVQIIGKITRYTNHFPSGSHSDSLQDIAVYALLLDEVGMMESGEVKIEESLEKLVTGMDVKRVLESLRTNWPFEVQRFAQDCVTHRPTTKGADPTKGEDVVEMYQDSHEKGISRGEYKGLEV